VERGGNAESAEAVEAELHASRDQLAAILAGVAEGITVQDRSGRLLYANDAAARLCGFASTAELLAASADEVVERFELFDETGAPFPLEHLPSRRVLDGQPAGETILRFRPRPGGEERWSMTSATAIRDESGEVVMAVSIFHDVTERKRSEDTARFLAAVNLELTRSLDYERTLRRVAELSVPTLADWCVVDVLDEEGRLRRLAVAHSDPAKVQLAEMLTQRYPEDASAPHGTPRILRTGRPELVPDISDEQLAAGARDAEHLEILRSLGLRSVIIVPLVARSRTLGTITLVAAESGRRYGRRDLELAQDLATRAALAVDNARLYREAQQQAATHVELNAALRDTMEQLRQALKSS
jgi:PAS domain S-box-containing protein